MARHLQAAFDAIVKDARAPERWYVALVEHTQYYGGPEEGGWWGTDTDVVAFREYPTEEEARAAVDAVKKLAADLDRDAKHTYGKQCQMECDWLEARGLDADFLPEPDGPAKYAIYVGTELPEPRRGCRHYE